jgi:tetratricopeptide (TPR) repeat protein
MSSQPKPSRSGTADQPHGFASWFAASMLPPIAALVIVSLAVYYNSLSNGFVFDDYAVIVENKHISDLPNSLPSFFNHSYFTIAAGEASYRPLATLSYFLIHALAGPNPFYFHLGSVLLHALNVVLAYLFLGLLPGDRFKALLAGLLFACHPVLTEAVDCIAFNEDLLAAFFCLLALILYLKTVESGAAGASYILSLLFFFCGLLSKEMAITLPLIIVLYDLTFTGDRGPALSLKSVLGTIWSRWRFYAGYAGIGLFYLVLRFVVFINPAEGGKPDFGSLFERLLYLPSHIFSFIRLTLAPLDLNAAYVFSYPQGFFEFSNLVGWVITLGLAVGSFFLFRRFKVLFFGIWWFLITLIPVYNLIPIFNPLAERYLYIPIIGFCLAAASVLHGACRKALNLPAAAELASLTVVLAIVSVYATATIARNRDWKDGLTLWSKTVKQSPASGIAHGSLGRAYQEQGLLDQAIAEYRQAIKIMPNHFKAYYNLAVVYDQQGDFAKAVESLKRSIAINPGYANAHYNLAIIYHKQGLMADAIGHYKKVIDLMPDDFEARNNLGVALAMQGQLDQAILEWERVLKIDPANKSAQDNLSKARAVLKNAN